MAVSIDNFSLLAVPFFVLVGELMNTGGVTKRIIDFFRNLLGHVRGGIAYVNIVTSGFLSSIIGSANAVAAITSKAIVPEMRKDGYSNDYSSAVSAASSIMGPLIPPSMVLIIYGITASTSVGALFLAGIVPGLLVLIGFCIVAWFFSRKLDVKYRERATMKKRRSVSSKRFRRCSFRLSSWAGLLRAGLQQQKLVRSVVCSPFCSENLYIRKLSGETGEHLHAHRTDDGDDLGDRLDGQPIWLGADDGAHSADGG